MYYIIMKRKRNVQLDEKSAGFSFVNDWHREE